MGYVCEEYMIEKECIEGIEDMKRNINFLAKSCGVLSRGKDYREVAKECVCCVSLSCCEIID